MGVEIERKFLPAGDAWRDLVATTTRIAQGYLVGADALAAGQARAAVRIREAGGEAWLTVKSAVPGIMRDEYEYAVPPADAARMLAGLCVGVVEKQRHVVPVAGFRFEVDEFLGENAGLVVIELELADAGQAFPRPAWLGREVSDEARYYNVNLASRPYRTWDDRERAEC